MPWCGEVQKMRGLCAPKGFTFHQGINLSSLLTSNGMASHCCRRSSSLALAKMRSRALHTVGAIQVETEMNVQHQGLMVHEGTCAQLALWQSSCQVL